MFDELPFHSLRGLVPIALNMQRVKTAKARMTRLHEAESSGILTVAEQEVTQVVVDEELGFFIHRSRRRQRWARPLWVASTYATSTELVPLAMSEELTLLDQLEAEAAHSVGVTVEDLSRLRMRCGVDSDGLTPEEQKSLRQAAARLARDAASTTRRMSQSRAAHLVAVYVTTARTANERFTIGVAAKILKAPDTARQTMDRERRIRRETAGVASTLPGGKPQQMCEVDYLQLVCDQVAQALHGIDHRVQSKRIVVLTPSVPEDDVSQTALPKLVEVFGDTCVRTGSAGDVAIRIPRPSQFGITLLRARSCDCGRHPVYGPDGE
ncbi:hypothetical protein ACFQ61_09665 [Streptomyces sp. NPDC056500]|uniref:hypothetical protein n=1 Tax=Streptomyces sp. NPDC056500 TaxID=3345840 RepID=UPI0036B78ED1